MLHRGVRSLMLCSLTAAVSILGMHVSILSPMIITQNRSSCRVRISVFGFRLTGVQAFVAPMTAERMSYLNPSNRS